MKTITVRDLRYQFPKVERMLREGQDIEVTKRRRVVARLVPERPAVEAALPDFLAQLRKIYGNKKLKVSGAELLEKERDRF